MRGSGVARILFAMLWVLASAVRSSNDERSMVWRRKHYRVRSERDVNSRATPARTRFPAVSTTLPLTLLFPKHELLTALHTLIAPSSLVDSQPAFVQASIADSTYRTQNSESQRSHNTTEWTETRCTRRARILVVGDHLLRVYCCLLRRETLLPSLNLCMPFNRAYNTCSVAVRAGLHSTKTCLGFLATLLVRFLRSS